MKSLAIQNNQNPSGHQQFAIPDDLERLIDEKAAGEFLGVTRRTMQNWRLKGGGPKYVWISA